MIITDKDAQAQHLALINHEGKPYRKCRSYDTETKEAEFYATVSVGDGEVHIAEKWTESNRARSILTNSLELVTFKCHLIGAKLIDKITGEEYLEGTAIDSQIGEVFSNCTCQTIGGATCSACNEKVGEQ